MYDAIYTHAKVIKRQPRKCRSLCRQNVSNIKISVGSIPSNKRIMSESQVRRELNASFARNCHPTAIGMQKLSERCGIRYKTIFDNFETIRKDGKIECETNDACCRIREFLSRETDTTSYIEITNEVQTVLEDEIELHLLSRKRFTLGYVHVVK